MVYIHVAEPGVTGGDALTALPFLHDELWTPTSAVTACEYSLGICTGAPCEGDIASWCDQLTRGRVGVLRVTGDEPEVYPPLLCERTAGCIVEFCARKALAARGEDNVEASATTIDTMAGWVCGFGHHGLGRIYVP